MKSMITISVSVFISVLAVLFVNRYRPQPVVEQIYTTTDHNAELQYIRDDIYQLYRHAASANKKELMSYNINNLTIDDEKRLFLEYHPLVMKHLKLVSFDVAVKNWLTEYQIENN